MSSQMDEGPEPRDGRRKSAPARDPLAVLRAAAEEAEELMSHPSVSRPVVAECERRVALYRRMSDR